MKIIRFTTVWKISLIKNLTEPNRIVLYKTVYTVYTLYTVYTVLYRPCYLVAEDEINSQIAYFRMRTVMKGISVIP